MQDTNRESDLRVLPCFRCYLRLLISKIRNSFTHPPYVSGIVLMYYLAKFAMNIYEEFCGAVHFVSVSSLNIPVARSMFRYTIGITRI